MLEWFRLFNIWSEEGGSFNYAFINILLLISRSNNESVKQYRRNIKIWNIKKLKQIEIFQGSLNYFISILQEPFRNEEIL